MSLSYFFATQRLLFQFALGFAFICSSAEAGSCKKKKGEEKETCEVKKYVKKSWNGKKIKSDERWDCTRTWKKSKRSPDPTKVALFNVLIDSKKEKVQVLPALGSAPQLALGAEATDEGVQTACNGYVQSGEATPRRYTSIDDRGDAFENFNRISTAMSARDKACGDWQNIKDGRVAGDANASKAVAVAAVSALSSVLNQNGSSNAPEVKKLVTHQCAPPGRKLTAESASIAGTSPASVSPAANAAVQLINAVVQGQARPQ